MTAKGVVGRCSGKAVSEMAATCFDGLVVGRDPYCHEGLLAV
jgi:hypothetical protein